MPALHPACQPCLPCPPWPYPAHTAYPAYPTYPAYPAHTSTTPYPYCLPAYTQTLPLLDGNRQGKPIPYPYSMTHHRQFLDAMHKSAEGGMSRDARPLLADTCARFADAAEVDKVL